MNCFNKVFNFTYLYIWQASDKLKSEEEIAKEEKERLEKLESDRLKRMKGIEDDGILKHRSADDLDDGYIIILCFELYFNGFTIIIFIVK